MAWEVIARVLRLRMPATKKMVAMSFANAAHKDGGGVFPSIDRVAAEAGVHWRTASDATADLVADRILVVVDRPPKGSKKPVRYRFDLERMDEMIARDPIKIIPHERKKKSRNQDDASASGTLRRTRKRADSDAVKPHRQEHLDADLRNNTPQMTGGRNVPKPVLGTSQENQSGTQPRAHAREDADAVFEKTFSDRPPEEIRQWAEWRREAFRRAATDGYEGRCYFAEYLKQEVNYLRGGRWQWPPKMQP